MTSVRKREEMTARRERWRRIVTQASTSGLPVREFCRKHAVHEGVFYYWRRLLQLEAPQSKPETKPGFVLVRAAGEPHPDATIPALELVLDGGWRLRIPRGVDEASLRTVLSALTART